MNENFKTKKITLEDLPLFDKFLKDYNEENCDYNICNMLSWGIYFKLEYFFYKNIVVCYNPHNDFLIFPTFNELTCQDILLIYKKFKQDNPNMIITAITENNIRKLPNIYDFFQVENNIDWNDYIYYTKDLAELNGRKFSKKKNLINQFKKLFPDYLFLPITSDDKMEILNFCEEWKKNYYADDHLIAEGSAIKTILTNWDIFPCEGLKLIVDNKLVGFTVWSKQTDEMACVHFEKSNQNYKGAAQIINQFAANKILNNNFKYINREQDMGLKGIRQAKQSYFPCRMLPFYNLFIK